MKLYYNLIEIMAAIILAAISFQIFFPDRIYAWLNMSKFEKEVKRTEVQLALTDDDRIYPNELDRTCNWLDPDNFPPKRIIVHHTATAQSTNIDVAYKAVWNYHMKRRLKWAKEYWVDIQSFISGTNWMMYHRMIWKNWEVRWTKSFLQTGWGTKCNNRNTIHLVLVWNFEIEKPTEEQYKELNNQIKEIRKEYWNIPVFWHKEMYKEATTCPWKNFDYSKIRKEFPRNVEEKYPPHLVVPNQAIIPDWYKLYWQMHLTRYYSCDKNQTKWLSREKKSGQTNYNSCMKRQFNWDTDSTIDALWNKLSNEHAWKIAACPRKKWTKQIALIYNWKLFELKCNDVWWAIKWNRIDIYAGIWDYAIENRESFPTGKVQIYIKDL